MLLAGPQVVAEDKGKPTAAEAKGASPYAKKHGAGDGKALFATNCGSCHTLARAGTSGSVGPKLDGLGLSAGDVEAVMRSGPGVMPSFDGQLTAADIKAIAT